MGAGTGSGGIYDSPTDLLADPDYVLAPCGAVVHADDDHEAQPCELCDDLRKTKPLDATKTPRRP